LLKVSSEQYWVKGGDGDGCYYSEFFDIKDVVKAVEDSGILPDFWVKRVESNLTIFYCDGEYIVFTNIDPLSKSTKYMFFVKF